MAQLVFFSADNGMTGRELWVTDGTSNGTRLVRDLLAGPNSGLSRTDTLYGGNDMAALDDGRVVFSSQGQLWISNGTESGTFSLGVAPANPEGFVQIAAGLAVFSADHGGVDSIGRELWATDGTPGGTRMVADLYPGTHPEEGWAYSSDPTQFLALDNGIALFVATSAAGGRELWRTDGTAVGTRMVTDIMPGSGGSSPTELYQISATRAVFSADDGAHGREVRVTDGNSAQLLADLLPGTASSDPRSFATLPDGRVTFVAENPMEDGYWRQNFITDGTSQGTSLAELRPGDALPENWSDIPPAWELAEGELGYYYTDSTPPLPVLVLGDGRLLFRAVTYEGTSWEEWYNPATGQLEEYLRKTTLNEELWITDGTKAGTQLVADILEGFGSSSPSGFFPLADGRVLFTGRDNDSSYDENGVWIGTHRSLFVTDGTEGGTQRLLPGANLVSFGENSDTYIRFFTPGAVHFAAESDLGDGWWTTDGTREGTKLVIPGLDGVSSYDRMLQVSAQDWLVTGRQFDGGNWQVWVTNGTPEGSRFIVETTTRIKVEDGLSLGDGRVLISLDRGDTGIEPWIINTKDGSLHLLRDIAPGSLDAEPMEFTLVGSFSPPVPESLLPDEFITMEEETAEIILSENFTDPNKAGLTFDVRDLPFGVTYDPVTTKLSGAVSAAETQNVNVTATDGQGVSGTGAFDWTVVDTGLLRISSTGEWQRDSSGAILSSPGSVVTIGRKDGTEKLFSVEGGTPTNPVVKIDKGKITIDGEIFSEQFDARLGGTERAVMEGNFTVDMATLAVSGFKDDKVTDDYRLMGGLIDMTFADIVIDKNQINFRTDIAFDASLGDIPTLGALSTTNAPLSVTFSDAGVGFGASAGGRWLPEPVTLDLGGSGLSLGFSDIGIEYDSASDSIYLSGKASFGWGGEIANQFDFVGNDSERSQVIDLAGTVQTDNYFQRGDKYFHLYKGSAPLDLDWDVIGSVTYQDKYEGEIPRNGFLVKELKIDLNTVTDILSGGFTATIPWAFDKRDISATLGLKYAPTWQLDSIGFGIDGLNAPLGTTGIFVQGGKLALEDLANADPKAPAIYKAEISGTWGPNSSALPSPIRGKITGQVKFPELEAGIQLDSKVGYFVPTIVNKYAEPLIEYFGVNPSAVTNYVLFDLAATAKTDLSADSYSLSGSFKSLNNAFVGTATLKAFADYEVDIEKGFDGKGDMNFEASVTGLFTVPTAFPLIGGRSRGGSGLVKYSADDDYSNDTISAWTQITIPLGFTTKVYGAGVRFALDGEWELLGRNTIPKLSSWALQDTTDLVILSAEWQIASDNVAIELTAPDGSILSEADIAARSDIALVADLNSDTSRHVALEFPQTGIWDLRVVNPSGLGAVSYYASDMLESAVAEFVSVTPDTDAHGAAISLSTDSGDAGAGRVVIFAGDQTGLTGGVEIASYDLQDGFGSLSHDLDYSQLGPGTWYLYTRTEADGVVPVVRMFDEPLVITGAADLGVTIRQINFGPTGTPVLVIEVTNTGDRPSDPGAVFIEVPEAMIGATPVEETGAGPLSAAQTVLTLPALAPGASMEWRYALAPGTEDLADAISVEAVAAGIDANPQDNRSDFVLHENDLREVDQFKIADEYGDTVIGDGGNDTLVGSDYNDLFFGGGGSDDVDGRGGGSDLMGFDYYDGFVASNGLSIDLSTGIVQDDGTGATDTIFLVEDILGTRHDDLILGDGSSNYLAGLAGNDTISGFDSTDLIWGGDGLDVLDGGAGSDMLLFITAGTRFDYDGIPFGFFGIPLGTHGVQVNLATGAVLDEFGFQETVIGFENVSGTGYADSLIGDGIRNVLFGDDGADYIDGAGGNDRLEGGGGNDTLIGGDGFDHAAYYNAFSSVVVNLATGQATDDGDGGTDTLSGIEGLFGSEYSDVLIGDDAGNEIIGLGGDDTIDGGGGWDNVYYGNAPFWVVVDLATGEVSGGDGNDRLTSIEWVFGSDYSDALLGDDLDNDLRGLWGDDELYGRGGNDTLVGGAGDDTIDGGAGIDTVGYSGNQTSYTLTLGPGGTTLTDRRDGIEGTDQLSNVELLDFGTDLFGSAFDLTKFGGLSGLSPEDFQSFIEMYIAYFNRAPDAVGLFFWGTAFGNGTSLDEMATLFIDQDETRAAYPAGTSNEDFAATVYENVLGRLPDAAGFDFWVGLLDDQSVGRDAFILEVLRGAKAAPPQDATAEFIQQQLADQAYLGTKTDLGAYFAVHKGMSDVANASAAMGLFDGSASSVTMARSAIDGYYADALDPENGEFLMQLVGVLDDPF